MQVSVIMPTYNCEKFIEQAVRSVINQTITDWEIQIADDCSTDHTYEVLKPYLEKDSRIHYFCLERNQGPAAARTEAIRRAQGKYIAFLDSDDLWKRDKLEKQIRFMEETGTVFSCTAYEQMDEQGGLLHVTYLPPLQTDYRRMLRLSNPIGNLTVMYDQEILGKYEVPLIQKRNDFALWLKILRDTPYCMGMQDSLAVYRIRGNSVSSCKWKQARYHWELYYKIEKLGLLRSVGAMFCWFWVKGTGLGLKKRRG